MIERSSRCDSQTGPRQQHWADQATAPPPAKEAYPTHQTLLHQPAGALTDAAWAQHCNLAALPSVSQIVHSIFEQRPLDEFATADASLVRCKQCPLGFARTTPGNAECPRESRISIRFKVLRLQALRTAADRLKLSLSRGLRHTV